MAGERSRTYIYSPEDEMVEYRHVERHAEEAREKRAGVKVRTERFEGSRHVAHMRLDPERYWRVVGDTWRDAVAQHR